MGYLMEADNNDNVFFYKHRHKNKKILNKKKYKRIQKIKKNSKRKNRK